MNRRRLLMGTNRTYVFKEGEGFVFGKYVLYSEYNSEVGTDYIKLGGRAWGVTTNDDDSSHGMIIGAKAFKYEGDNVYGTWYEDGSAFDFSEYKTLNFEFALTTSNGNHGYVGYCEDQRINRGWLYHSDNEFNGYDIANLYRGGAYKTILGTARQTVSFDISEKTSGIIAMLSPIAYANGYYAKIFNIWFE